MTIGIFALRTPDNSVDLPRFKAASKTLGIETKFFRPVDISINIFDDTLQMQDRFGSPIVLDGAVNWIPYTGYDEISHALEIMGVPYINTAQTVRSCRNKMLTSLLLQKEDILQPDTKYYMRMGKADTIKMPMPAVYKNKSGTHGIDATKFLNDEMLQRFLKTKNERNSLYLQRFIENYGFDYRIVVVGGAVIGALKKTYASGEWRTHVKYGGMAQSVQVSPELISLSLRVAKTLKIDFAGIDIMPGAD